MFSPLKNIWIKTVALALGLLLWIHVATEKSYNHEVTLPLQDIVLKEGTALAEIPADSVTVIVSASGKQLLRDKWRQRGLRLNAANLAIGRRELSLTPANLSLIEAEDVSLEEIILPTAIDLLIDHLIEKSVPVKPDLITMPDEGYAVRKMAAPEPPEVMLRGPRSLLRRYDTILTEKKEITNLRTDRTVTLALAAPSGYGLTATPDSVSLHLEVVPVKTKMLERIPIVAYNVALGQNVRIEPATISLELTGPPDEIGRLQSGAIIAAVDYLKADSTGTTAITIECPSNFKVKRSSADSAQIIID